MKKVLIVGAGKGQVPFCKICRSRGYQILTVSIPGDYPCFSLADKVAFIDTRDKEAILDFALKEKIDAVLTDQSDLSCPSVAYVAEKMGIRGIGYETSLRFTNKYLMRESCKKAGIPMPLYGKAHNIDEAESIVKNIGFPLIIKPADSCGSLGVFKINSLEELHDKFELSKSNSLSETVMVEEFIKGKEYLVDGYGINNKYWNLDLGIKEHFIGYNSCVSKMCMFSSAKIINDPIEEKVLDTNRRIVKALGLPFGITHAEYIYNKENDTVYLVEIAARGGGVFLSSDLTPLATGFNTNEALIDYVVENKVIEVNADKINTGVSGWLCFALPPGKIFSVKGEDKLRHIKGIHKVYLDDVTIGDNTRTLKDDNGKYGPILFKGNSRRDCYNIINKIKDELSVKVMTSEGLREQIW